jgi:hypothetical protein
MSMATETASAAIMESIMGVLHRFGRAGYNGARPLKIELSTPADSREVLASANTLRRHDSTAFLRLSPWLSDANMAKVKALRNQCKVLNDNALANGCTNTPLRCHFWCSDGEEE